MASVTKRIRDIKQPRGGYLNPKDLNKFLLQDDIVLSEENIFPGIVGIAVDYMTRFMLGTSKRDAFKISLIGARLACEDDMADIFLSKIEGLDDKSLKYACKLAGYDTVYRAGISTFVPVDTIEPNKETLENIRIMVNRSLHFFELYGPITKDGFDFRPNGYTNTVDTGDGDFLTKDTLWDFKTSKNEPKNTQTLQLLMYYVMGKKSGQKIFNNIKKIGIYNPRLNVVYTYDMSNFPKELIEDIENNVICY